MELLRQAKKTTTGRKKIEMKEIDKDANKQVTFSKRRSGLFKKASELCVLCDAHVAIIVFSPANKVFCFGQPSVDSILGRFHPGPTAQKPEAHSTGAHAYEELNRQHEEAVKALETEKERLAEVKGSGAAWSSGNWWNLDVADVDLMNLEELEQYMMAMHEMRGKVSARADELMMKAAMVMPLPATASFYGECSYGADGAGYLNYNNNQFISGDIGGGSDHHHHLKFGF